MQENFNGSGAGKRMESPPAIERGKRSSLDSIGLAKSMLQACQKVYYGPTEKWPVRKTMHGCQLAGRPRMH